eukprot:767700-Pyramimonas_sp.AAC.1
MPHDASSTGSCSTTKPTRPRPYSRHANPTRNDQFGAEVNGVRADPAACLAYYASRRFDESLENKRQLQQGLELMESRAQPNERIDRVLARLKIARVEPNAAGIG